MTTCLLTLWLPEVKERLTPYHLQVWNVVHSRLMRSLLASWWPSSPGCDQAPMQTVRSWEVPGLGCGAPIVLWLDAPHSGFRIDLPLRVHFEPHLRRERMEGTNSCQAELDSTSTVSVNFKWHCPQMWKSKYAFGAMTMRVKPSLGSQTGQGKWWRNLPPHFLRVLFFPL